MQLSGQQVRDSAARSHIAMDGLWFSPQPPKHSAFTSAAMPRFMRGDMRGGGGGGANRMAPPGRGSASSRLKPPLISESTKASSVMAAQAGRKAGRRPPTRTSGALALRGRSQKPPRPWAAWQGRLAMTALSAAPPSIGAPAAAA